MVHLQDSRRYVCDPDGIMQQTWRDSTDIYLQKLDHEHGVESVFIIVNQVQGGDVFRIAQEIGNKYGVGNKKTNRGIVVIIAVKDRKYFIAPGKGLEGDLTDVECNDIAQATIVTNMRYENADMAVFETTKALYKKLHTGKTGIATIDNAEKWTLENTIILIILILAFFGIPIIMLISWILSLFGIKWPKNIKWTHDRNRHDNDHFPPFIIMGGGNSSGWGSGFSGGSFGGGSFGGGGAGGSW